jgi:trehalose 6-phosphate phosphatase
MRGKMVVEVLPNGVSKGHAIDAFLAEPPFAGRRPVFLGDDVTDEHGFAAVQRLGGQAVKVGPGETVAALHLGAPDNVRRWLHDACHVLCKGKNNHVEPA